MPNNISFRLGHGSGQVRLSWSSCCFQSQMPLSSLSTVLCLCDTSFNDILCPPACRFSQFITSQWRRQGGRGLKPPPQKGQRGMIPESRSVVCQPPSVFASVCINIICSIVVFHTFAPTKCVWSSYMHSKCVCGCWESLQRSPQTPQLVGRKLESLDLCQKLHTSFGSAAT